MSSSTALRSTSSSQSNEIHLRDQNTLPTLSEKQAELAYLLSLRDASAAMLDGYQALHQTVSRLKTDASENYRLFKLWSEVMKNAGQINDIPRDHNSEGLSQTPLFVKIPRE